MEWIEKPRIIEAFQFRNNDPFPLWFSNKIITGKMSIFNVEDDIILKLNDREMLVRYGDYIVLEKDEHINIWQEEHFENTFEVKR